jgi:hypothetical protein
MNPATPVALVLALLSTTMTNLAYAREHDAAAGLPVLSGRRPLHSLHLLLADRQWLRAFVLETGGFLLYAAALALASLSLVQSVAAGGIGILAYVSARRARRRLRGRELAGVAISIAGLLALAISLASGGDHGVHGTIVAIAIWLGATGAVAGAVLALGQRRLGRAAAYGIAGGLLFSIGDISTKIVTQGGLRTAFVVTLILGYALGTSLLQIGYQAGGAVTVAGLATLFTNALPIAAGTIVLREGVPGGWLGALRALAFAAVTAGAVLLARPDPRPRRASPSKTDGTPESARRLPRYVDL